MKLSAVIPVYDEESVLPEFHRRLTAALERQGWPYECIYVDDGSRDHSLRILRTLAATDPRVVLLSLSRNFGHQAALTAGLDYASGDVVAVLDADLQDPPELIPTMCQRLGDGFEVVFAIRSSRQEGFVKRFCYRAFYQVLSRIAEVDIYPDAGDFCVMDRRVVEVLREARERNRFVRGIRSWAGFRQTGLEYDRPARHAGETHYSWMRLVRLAGDGIFSFSHVPLRLALYGGFLGVAGSFALAAVIIVRRLLEESFVPGVTSTIVLVLFFGGVQLLMGGILGEYIGRIYDEVKSRPLYVIRERVNTATPRARAEGDS